MAELTRPEAEALLYREARLLDERRFEEWLALFADDAHYLVPSGDAAPGGPAEPAIIDDDRPGMEDRVHRLRSPATWAQSPPSHTLHLVANVELGAPDGQGGQAVHAACVIHESRLGRSRAFAARCLYILRPSPEGGPSWRIALKRVALLEADQPLFNLTFLL